MNNTYIKNLFKMLHHRYMYIHEIMNVNGGALMGLMFNDYLNDYYYEW